MPQHQIGDLHGLGQFAGVLDGAVVFFIGLPQIPLHIKAEGLMEQPVAVPYIFFAYRVIGLVSQEGQLFPII